jgi:hypothetical protein
MRKPIGIVSGSGSWQQTLSSYVHKIEVVGLYVSPICTRKSTKLSCIGDFRSGVPELDNHIVHDHARTGSPFDEGNGECTRCMVFRDARIG